MIGDQARRVATQGQATLGITVFDTLALALWGANAGAKAIFDALNIIYKEPEKRSFVVLMLQSLTFTVGGIVLVLLAIAGILIVPTFIQARHRVLKSNLTPDQLHDFLPYRRFDVVGGVTGRTYRIHFRGTMNVKHLGPDGRCVRPSMLLPGRGTR